MKQNTVFLAGVVCILLASCNNIFYTLASSGNEPDTGEYIVRFDKNGGDTEAYPQTIIVKAPGSTVMLPSVEPEREGYIFTAWNTEKDGSGAEFTRDTLVKANITVYAQWLYLPPGSFIVHFDKNNTDLNSPEAHPQNKAVIPPSDTITDGLPAEPTPRTGYYFDGWNTDADGNGVEFTENTPVSDNITVYAQWEPYKCIITFDKNHDDEDKFTEANPQTITVIYTGNPAASVDKLPTPPTRDYYNFFGWNKEADGTGEEFTASTPVGILENKPLTVYAQWAEKTYTIKGTILKSDGGGASGATVELFGEVNLRTTADSDGYYEFADVLSREGYTIRASLTGYSDEEITFDMPREDYEVEDLVLQKLCRVTFETNGGSSVPFQDLKSGERATPPPNPAKTGYTFDNWYTASDTVYDFGTLVTEDITLYAKWIAITFTVRYNANDGSGNIPDQSFTYDVPQNLTINNNSITRTGYTFGGWARTAGGPKEFDDGASVSNLASTQGATVTLFAKWNAITYTVSYNANGGSGTTANSTHTYGESKTLTPNAYTRSGYAFTGWNTQADGEGTSYTDRQSVLNLADTQGATVTLFAQWVEAKTVTFDKNGGNTEANPQTKLVISPATTVDSLPTPPTRTGYNFSGWNTEANGSGTAFIATTPVTADIKVYAQWTAITYTVVYMANGADNGTMSTQSFTYNVAQNLIVNAYNRTGYTFEGWARTAGGPKEFDNEESVSNLASTQGATVNLYAVWKGITYTVRYNANGGSGSMADQTFTYGSPQSLRSISFIPPANHTFAGWATTAGGVKKYDDGESVNNLTTTQGDTVDLFALWVEIPQYTVSFNINGGSGTTPAAQTVYANTIITLPGQGDLLRDGYTFGGWNTNAVGNGTNYAAGAPYTVTETRTLYAKWNEIPQYTITFSINGGSGTTPASQTVSAGTSITLPNQGDLSRTGYTIGGWNTASNGSGTNYDAGSPYTVTGSATLYAKWNPIQYTVSFDANGGGGSMGSQSFTYGVSQDLNANAFIPPANQTFAGWNTQANGSGTDYTNGQSVSNLATTQGATVTLFAQWEAIQQYTITFNINNGSGTTPASQTVNAGASITLPDDSGFSREGYTFGGWNTQSDGDGTNYAAGSSYSVTGTRTLYAKWNEIPQDTITFSANSATSGTAPSPMTATRGAVITLPNQGDLSRTGYTFDGWNTNAAGTGTSYAVGASYTVNGSATLYAKWNPITYTVEFNANGGTGDMEPQAFTYGASQNLHTNTFTPPADHSFAGWNTQANGSGTGYTNNQSVSNLTTTQGATITLFAQWNEISTPPTPTASGKITLSDDKTNYQDVLVQLYTLDSSLKIVPLGAPIKPDAEGYYYLPEITEPYYFITASLDGYITAVEYITPFTSFPVNLELQLDTGASHSINLQQLLLQLNN